jgi:hypothetical protein
VPASSSSSVSPETDMYDRDLWGGGVFFVVWLTEKKIIWGLMRDLCSRIQKTATIRRMIRIIGDSGYRYGLKGYNFFPSFVICFMLTCA